MVPEVRPSFWLWTERPPGFPCGLEVLSLRSAAVVVLEQTSEAFSHDDSAGANDGTQVNTTDWWDTNWLNRITITFDNSASGSALSNFPVAVSLTSSEVNFAKIKLATGANLLSDGTHATSAVQGGLAAMSFVSRTGLSPTTAGVDATTAAAITSGLSKLPSPAIIASDQ